MSFARARTTRDCFPLQSFFVVRLRNPMSNPPTLTDTDPLIQCELMESRDAFLNFARDRHCEFSSLRRAKYSTMVALIDLHSSTTDKNSYTCNSCRQQCDIRYHCTVCDDYDLCSKCYATVKHEHRMDRTDDATETPTSSDTPISIQQQKQLNMQRMLDAIRHAVQCRNANCIFKNCAPCQRLLQHAKECTKPSRNQCPLCSKLVSPIWNHAKTCSDQNCPVRRARANVSIHDLRVFRSRIVRASSRDCNGNEQQRFSQIDDVYKPCIERKWDQVHRR